MALETLDNQIDIRQLNIGSEHERAELMFDPDLEFSPAEWEKFAEEVKGELASAVANNTLSAWAENAAIVKMFKPELIESVLTEDLFLTYCDRRDEKQERGDWQQCGRMVAQFKLLFPDRAVLLGEKTASKIKQSLAQVATSQTVNRYVFTAHQGYSYKILFPDAEYPDEVERNWDKLMGKISELPSWNHFSAVMYLAELRVMDPARFPESVRNSDIWRNIVKKIHETKQSNLYQAYAKAIFDMAIVMAEKVVIDSQGLHLIMERESAEPASQEIPASRKF